MSEEEKEPNFFMKLVGLQKKEKPKEEPIEADKLLEKTQLKNLRNEPLEYNLTIESMQAGAEANYYWIYRFLKSKNPSFGMGNTFTKIIKIQDVYQAGEASSLWGSQEQRKGLQQDKVNQYMATISTLIKETFQIVRELRILDERLELYNGYDKGKEGESVTLKDTWVTLVEGGAKNPTSVFGLASQVGFTTLPDLFFLINPKTQEDVRKEVKKVKEVNRKVKEVLERKLTQFLIWKEKTQKELTTRKKFILKFLRMRFNNIKMYANWVKPYLRAIKQLQSAQDFENPEISSSFETSQIKLELLAIGKEYTETTDEGYEETYDFQETFPCLVIRFNYVAMPQMSYQKEFQRGPIHVGRTEIRIIPCTMTNEQIETYKAAKDKEIFQDVKDLIPSVEESLDAIGDELTKYLKEAGEVIEDDNEKIMKQKESIFTPFISIFKGFKEPFAKGKKDDKGFKVSKKRLKIEVGTAKDLARALSFVVYDIFKKAHGMLAP